MVVTDKHPIIIAILPQENLAIVSAERREEVPLASIIKKLNSLQTLFQYDIIAPPMDLDEYDLLHLYSDKVYYETMEHRIAKSPLKWVITIVSEDLEKGSFNRHSETQGFGIITVKHYKEYLPTAHNLEQYLSFLILCESFCIVSGQHIEHTKRKYCLFDMCEEKSDLIESIRRSYIHDECERKILAAGFKKEDLLEAEKILSFVRKPNTLHKFNKFVSSWPISLQIGFLFGLFASLVVALNLTIGGIILVILLFGLAVQYFMRK